MSYRVTFSENGKYATQITNDERIAVGNLIGLSEDVLQTSQTYILATDMDGVLEPDDLARTYCNVLDPLDGERVFNELSDAVLVPASEGKCPYGYTLVVLADALGRLDVNMLRAVGRNVRLTPGAREFVRHAQNIEYDIVATTCAYEAAALEVCKRVGILHMLAIEFGDRGELKSFTGGKGKFRALQRYLKKREIDDVIVIGDSWTDIDSFERYHPSTIAFNPQYPELNAKASVNVYAPDLRGLVPIIDFEAIFVRDNQTIDPSTIPQWVVFNDDLPKPQELVDEEVAFAKEMRRDIANAVNAVELTEDMLQRIRDETGNSDIRMIQGMHNIDVPKCVVESLERHAEFLDTLKD